MEKHRQKCSNFSAAGACSSGFGQPDGMTSYERSLALGGQKAVKTENSTSENERGYMTINFKPYLLATALCLPSMAMADISDEANACIDALMERFGSVGGEVLGQMGGEAGILVNLRDANGTEYECLVWEGPRVAELRVVDGEGSMADDGGGAMAGASDSTTERVEFASGTSGAELTGELMPGASRRYILGANEGQNLYFRLAANGPGMTYVVYNPDGSVMQDEVGADREFRNGLWQSGDHTIEVYNTSNAARSYNAIFGIE